MSAFCAFTGLTHPRKIQATTILDRDPVSSEHTHTEVPSIRYLGVDLDLRRDRNEQFDAVLLELECRRIFHLLLEAGSPQTKLEYTCNKILPIERYTQR